jgi:hypothetical protein
MKMYQKLILFICFTGIIVACATTTQLRKSWADPSLAQNPTEPFNKVLVMVNAKNEGNRRVAEDQLVSLFKNGKAIQSYTYVTPADTSQKELVEKLIKDGFDGVVMMRVKAVVQTRTKATSRGTSYESWYSDGNYYAHSYTYTFDNSGNSESSNIDVNSPKDYIIETNIYSLETKKLLWSGSTASLSAKKVDSAMTGIFNTVRKELQKKGFIKD